MEGKCYGEAYAGGGGAALSLLFSGHAKRILINDADPSIAAMWNGVLTKPIQFANLIKNAKLTIEEWRRQKEIYKNRENADPFELGFATFFLNRTNRSGIIKNAGPIGGFNQDGHWKIDARFNREELAERILRIGRYAKRIVLSNTDALLFLQNMKGENAFLYLDPPYFIKGRELYLNHYQPEDHRSLSDFMQNASVGKWLISYDDVPEIRRLYRKRRKVRFELSYSVRHRKVGKELLIPSDDLDFPDGWKRVLPPLATLR
jgi:DNA adenine methylase